jgi:hypothetical protein
MNLFLPFYLLDPKDAPVLTTYAHLTGVVADGLGRLFTLLPFYPKVYPC